MSSMVGRTAGKGGPPGVRYSIGRGAGRGRRVEVWSVSGVSRPKETAQGSPPSVRHPATILRTTSIGAGLCEMPKDGAFGGF